MVKVVSADQCFLCYCPCVPEVFYLLQGFPSAGTVQVVEVAFIFPAPVELQKYSPESVGQNQKDGGKHCGGSGVFQGSGFLGDYVKPGRGQYHDHEGGGFQLRAWGWLFFLHGSKVGWVAALVNNKPLAWSQGFVLEKWANGRKGHRLKY